MRPSFVHPSKEKAQQEGQDREEGEEGFENPGIWASTSHEPMKNMTLELEKDESGLGLGIGMWKVNPDSHHYHQPINGDGESATEASPGRL
jgi:hypothetical protein